MRHSSLNSYFSGYTSQNYAYFKSLTYYQVALNITDGSTILANPPQHFVFKAVLHSLPWPQIWIYWDGVYVTWLVRMRSLGWGLFHTTSIFVERSICTGPHGRCPMAIETPIFQEVKECRNFQHRSYVFTIFFLSVSIGNLQIVREISVWFTYLLYRLTIWLLRFLKIGMVLIKCFLPVSSDISEIISTYITIQNLLYMFWSSQILYYSWVEKKRGGGRWEKQRENGLHVIQKGHTHFSLINLALPEIDTHYSASEEGCLSSCPQAGLFVSQRDINRVCGPLSWNNTARPSVLQKVLDTEGHCSQSWVTSFTP